MGYMNLLQACACLGETQMREPDRWVKSIHSPEHFHRIKNLSLTFLHTNRGQACAGEKDW